MRATLLLLLGFGGCWHAFPEGSADLTGARDRGLEARPDRVPLADRPVPDRAPERGPAQDRGDAGSSPCNPATAMLRWSSPGGVLAVCESKGLPRRQCTAAELCAADRVLCPATQYQVELAGAPPHPLATGAWLRGLVRNGAMVGALADEVAIHCDQYRGCGAELVAKPCNGGLSLSTTECYAGLLSSVTCWAVGTNGVQAYWEVAPSWSKRPAALCCRP